MPANNPPLILVVATMPLLPLTGGGAARVLSYIRHLRSAGFRVELVAMQHPVRERAALAKLVDALHIVRRIPHRHTRRPARLDRLQSFVPHRVRRVLRPGIRQVRRAWRRVRRGETAPQAGYESAIDAQRKPLADRFAAELAWRLRPAAAIGVFVWTARALEEMPPETLRIIDTIDIQHLRAPAAELAGYDLSRTACSFEEERAELLRANLLLAIQEEERAALEAMCPEREVILAEHALEIPEAFAPAPRDSREVLFVGNLYEPNVEGIRAFLGQVWPEVRERVPEARLTICGKVCRALHGGMPGVQLEGVVPDLAPYYARAALVINPVPYGTGLKIKTVEALAHGKALAVTPAGITGLPDGPDAPYRVAPLETMSAPVIELLADPDARDALAREAAAFARDRFRPERVYGPLVERLRAAAGRSESAAQHQGAGE